MSRPPIVTAPPLALVLGLTAASSEAQPLPPASQPPPGLYQPPPDRYEPPPPGYGQSTPAAVDAPPGGVAVTAEPASIPPATLSPAPSEPPPLLPSRHAPAYSLWVGARVSFTGFGFAFYDNELGQAETTGNFLGSGVAPQVDVGARVAHRFIPYVYWEHGFMAQGRRFQGSDARASTDFYGLGFRYVAGDVDSVAFLTDLSIGRRVVTISNGSQSYSMSGIEYFRLGLGAEIRVMTLFAVTPLVSISSGAFSGTDGSIDFGCATTTCADRPKPRYVNGADIGDSRAYVVLSIGAGIHFDVLGK